MTAPLKTDSEFTSQPTEVWGNEMVTETVTHSWAEDVPVPAPVSGGATQAVSYNTSDDWAAQASIVCSRIISLVKSQGIQSISLMFAASHTPSAGASLCVKCAHRLGFILYFSSAIWLVL